MVWFMNTGRKFRKSIYNTLPPDLCAPGKTEENSLFPSDELRKIEKFDLMCISCGLTKPQLDSAWLVLGKKNVYLELIITFVKTGPKLNMK